MASRPCRALASPAMKIAPRWQPVHSSATRFQSALPPASSTCTLAKRSGGAARRTRSDHRRSRQMPSAATLLSPMGTINQPPARISSSRCNSTSYAASFVEPAAIIPRPDRVRDYARTVKVVPRVAFAGRPRRGYTPARSMRRRTADSNGGAEAVRTRPRCACATARHPSSGCGHMCAPVRRRSSCPADSVGTKFQNSRASGPSTATASALQPPSRHRLR